MKGAHNFCGTQPPFSFPCCTYCWSFYELKCKIPNNRWGVQCTLCTSWVPCCILIKCVFIFSLWKTKAAGEVSKHLYKVWKKVCTLITIAGHLGMGWLHPASLTKPAASQLQARGETPQKWDAEWVHSQHHQELQVDMWWVNEWWVGNYPPWIRFSTGQDQCLWRLQAGNRNEHTQGPIYRSSQTTEYFPQGEQKQ